MTDLRILIFSLFTLLAHSPALWSQTVNPEEMPRPERELPTIQLQPVLFYNYELPEMYYLDGFNQFKKLAVSTRNPGAKQKVQVSNGGFDLYRKQTVEGITTMQPVIKLPVSSRVDNAYLFFYADSNGKLQHSVIEDSPERHPAQTVRFFNLTDEEVMALVNDQTYKLSAGEERVSPNVGGNNFRFRISFAMKEGKGYQQYTPVKVYKFITPDTRALMVVSYQLDEREEDASGNREKYWRPFMSSSMSRVPVSLN